MLQMKIYVKKYFISSVSTLRIIAQSYLNLSKKHSLFDL